MPSVNNGRSNGGRVLNIPKGRTKPTPKSSMPMARGRDLPLNKESLSSRKAKITKKAGRPYPNLVDNAAVRRKKK